MIFISFRMRWNVIFWELDFIVLIKDWSQLLPSLSWQWVMGRSLKWNKHGCAHTRRKRSIVKLTVRLIEPQSDWKNHQADWQNHSQTDRTTVRLKEPPGRLTEPQSDWKIYWQNQTTVRLTDLLTEPNHSQTDRSTDRNTVRLTEPQSQSEQRYTTVRMQLT